MGKPSEAKSRTIRVPDEYDAWIESMVTPYRSYTSLAVEMFAHCKATGFGKLKLQDKQKSGSMRK